MTGVQARVQDGEFRSAAAGGPVALRVVTPADCGAGLPLLLVLHGAGSSRASLDPDLLAELWADGTLPPVIAGCASTPTEGGFYIDGPAGAWESLVARELPALLAREHGGDVRRIALFGGSMGGYGALKMAFRQPGRFAGVAALAPAVFPTAPGAAVSPRNTLGVLAALRAAMQQGDPAAQDVPALARAGAAAIRASGLAIYLECGDSDVFGLQDGAEYLHRVLWDCDIGHEYRLTRGADHVGPDMRGRQREALAFLGRVLRDACDACDASAGPAVSPEVQKWLDTGAGAMPAVDFSSPAGPLVLRRMLLAERLASAALDPDTNRHFGQIRFDYPGEGCHN